MPQLMIKWTSANTFSKEENKNRMLQEWRQNPICLSVDP